MDPDLIAAAIALAVGSISDSSESFDFLDEYLDLLRRRILLLDLDVKRSPELSVDVPDEVFALYSSMSVVATYSQESSDVSFVRNAAAVDSKKQDGSIDANSIGALCDSGIAASLPIRSNWENRDVY